MVMREDMIRCDKLRWEIKWSEVIPWDGRRWYMMREDEKRERNKIWWDGMRWEKMKGNVMREDVISWEERRWAERRCTEKWYDVRWEDERRDVKWNDLKWGDEMTRHGTGWCRVNVLWGKMTQCDKMTWYDSISQVGMEWIWKSENEIKWIWMRF